MATTTPTPTPSVTPIFCGQGFTTGSYFYTDCCGNFVQGNSVNELISLDYTKPTNGITRMNVVATTSCPTPTQTPTPTNTPTTTNTPSVTRTQTPTPTTTVSVSPTPSNGAAYNLKNECDVFTLFDMGIRCQVLKLPSSNTTFDGILTMKVTGGTAPYSYYWNGGQRTQTLRNIPPGNYPITVVDYYGDYTANTICSIFAATPTPTPTTTTTPTVTPSPVWPSLCLIVSYGTVSYGPFQFVISGSQNGRPQWTSGNMVLGWSPINARWEIQGWTSSTGLPVSTNPTNIPTSSWAMAGGTGTQPQISMTEGTCPPYLPLLTNVVGTNTSCSGTLNCNGSISVTTSGGIAPYFYSINNGISYQTSNVFNGLCQGTYTVIINDSTGNTQTQVVVIGFDSAPTTYTISASLDRIETIGTTTQIAYWHVDVNPPITDGSVIQFDLNISINKEYNQPGTGTITDTIEVRSNSAPVYPSSTSSITSTASRPYCSPYETTTVSNTQTYTLEINAETTVSGTSTSILSITDGVVGSNGCITTLQQSILTAVNSAVINGSTCSAVVDNETPQGITNHSIQDGEVAGPVDDGGLGCSATVEDTYEGIRSYRYPDNPISSSVDEYINFIWSCSERPNRFNVYDSTGLRWSSDWVGQADYPGPWGASLNTSLDGSSDICFLSELGRYVRVDAGGANPSNPISDAFNYTIVCLGNCNQVACYNYDVYNGAEAPGDMTIQWTNCGGTNQEYVLPPGQSVTVCAQVGTLNLVGGDGGISGGVNSCS